MSKATALLAAGCMLILLASCEKNGDINNSTAPSTTESIYSAEPEQKEQERSEVSMTIKVGEKEFAVVLYDNAAAKELVKRLPVTVDMKELHGNEKYYYWDQDFPTDAKNPGTIKTGDLMLFGSDCLVLFYKEFTTSYSYTPLGYITKPEELQDAVDKGNVQITLQAIQ
ncbi:MAG: cyclophilin-like fold protein [bacterium]|nr:cyclophilin-like fold protein [bacterium]